MKAVTFKPTVGKIRSTIYTEKQKKEYEAKKVQYERLQEKYYLDTFSCKFMSKLYLDELENERLWAPQKAEIVPYLTMLSNNYWVLSYNFRLDVEIPRFNELLKLRKEPPLTLACHKHDPSERWFQSCCRFFDFDNMLKIFMQAGPIRMIHHENDLIMRRRQGIQKTISDQYTNKTIESLSFQKTQNFVSSNQKHLEHKRNALEKAKLNIDKQVDEISLCERQQEKAVQELTMMADGTSAAKFTISDLSNPEMPPEERQNLDKYLKK